MNDCHLDLSPVNNSDSDFDEAYVSHLIPVIPSTSTAVCGVRQPKNGVYSAKRKQTMSVGGRLQTESRKNRSIRRLEAFSETKCV